MVYNLPISFNVNDYETYNVSVFELDTVTYTGTTQYSFPNLTVNFTTNTITITPTQRSDGTWVDSNNTPLRYLKSDLYQEIRSPVNLNDIFVFKGKFQSNTYTQGSCVYPFEMEAFIQALNSGYQIISDTYTSVNSTGNFTLTLNTNPLTTNISFLHWGFRTSGQAVYNGSPSYVGLNGSVVVTDFVPYPCFLESSQILTDKGYQPIKDLRKGDLVKTLNHGFQPIALIGKRDIVHSALEKRIKDQLYQCSKDNYPKVFEPLILTGCHSILVDKFISEEQREKTIEVNGDTYVTDGKYRLPACADLRTSVYPVPGTYTIYHMALEHSDYYMNYGIYANGLLVETCSKRYLKELSGMEIME